VAGGIAGDVHAALRRIEPAHSGAEVDMSFIQKLFKYAKPAAVVAVAVLSPIWSALSDNQITSAEWLTTASVFLSAIGVAIVPELPVGIARYAKTFVTFFVAGTTSAAVLVVGGLTGREMIQIIITAALAIGVTAFVPNKGDYKATGKV
jgi:hypothetical protein